MGNCFSENPYEGGKIPPCSQFLGNAEPIIKDGKVIFRNENRAYYFISTVTNQDSSENGNQAPQNQILEQANVNFNLQISLATFIIGLFINKIQKGEIEYDANMPIHENSTANSMIHQLLQNSPQVQTDYLPQLSLVVSNGNAILALYTYTINITPLNFYILFLLTRLENNPAFFFGNNSFATEDPINFSLASLNICFPTI